MTDILFQEWNDLVQKENKGTFQNVEIVGKNYAHSGFPLLDKSKQLNENKIKLLQWKTVADVRNLAAQEIYKVLKFGPEAIIISSGSDSQFQVLSKNIDFNYVDGFVFGLQSSNINSSIRRLIPNQNYFSNRENDLLDLCRRVEQSLDQGENHVSLQYYLQMDYFDNVAKLKALQILVANIYKAFSREISFNIIASPDEKFLVSADENLIRLSFMANAAILGGADYISLLPFEIDINKARLALNVLNILKYESCIYQIPNATQGSYFIEQMVKQIVDQTWEQLTM